MAKYSFICEDSNPYILNVNNKQIDNFLIEGKKGIVWSEMPPVVKSISSVIQDHHYKMVHVLVEKKPTVMTINYKPISYHEEDCEEEPDSFDIPIPWQHYFLTFVAKADSSEFVFNNMLLAFSQTKIDTLEHVFHQPYLSNIMEYEGLSFVREVGTSNICSIMPKGMKLEDSSLSEIFNAVHQAFWHDSTFNDDTWVQLEGYVGSDDPIEAYVDLQAFSVEYVLTDDSFDKMDRLFTFQDYLLELVKGNNSSRHDFKEFFTSVVDVDADVLKMKPKPKLEFKKIQKQTFRNEQGQFISRDEWMKLNGMVMIDAGGEF